jgi:hypothetical protein
VQAQNLIFRVFRVFRCNPLVKRSEHFSVSNISVWPSRSLTARPRSVGSQNCILRRIRQPAASKSPSSIIDLPSSSLAAFQAARAIRVPVL